MSIAVIYIYIYILYQKYLFSVRDKVRTVRDVSLEYGKVLDTTFSYGAQLCMMS